MAVITSAGTGNSNTGGTWTGGSVPTASDDVQIQSGHTITLNTTHTWNSLDLQSGGTLDGDGNLLTIDGEDGGGYAVDLDGAISGTDTDITITIAAATNVDLVPSSGTIRNLTINHASAVVNIRSAATTISGNLTITAGTLDTANSGSNLDLTVTGDVSVTGTLTGNASAISMGSLTIASGGTYSATSGTTTLTGKNSSNYMLQNSGTFTHNKGTVKFEADTSSGTWYDTNATNVEADSIKFYNLETVRTGSAGSYRFYAGGNSFYLVVLNNLTIGVNTNIHSSNGTSILRHYGPLFNIEGQASFDNVTDVQCGLITIGSAGVLEFDNGDQAISCTGIRNLRGSAGIQA